MYCIYCQIGNILEKQIEQQKRKHISDKTVFENIYSCVMSNTREIFTLFLNRTDCMYLQS